MAVMSVRRVVPYLRENTAVLSRVKQVIVVGPAERLMLGEITGRMRPHLMQVANSATILLINVFDCVLHGVLGGSNDCVRGQIHCNTKSTLRELLCATHRPGGLHASIPSGSACLDLSHAHLRDSAVK